MPESAPHRCRGCKELVKGMCPTCDTWGARSSPNWTNVPHAEMLAWRRFSRHWLKFHPFCMECGAPATRVCHKPDTNYLYDRLNPRAIEGQRCQHCDAVITGRQGHASRAKW